MKRVRTGINTFFSQKLNHLVVPVSFLIMLSGQAKCQVAYQDSLRNILATTVSNEQKLNALILLGLERSSLHADSLDRYAKEAQKLAKLTSNEEAMLEALLMQGHVWYKRGEGTKAIALANKEVLKEYTMPGLRHKQRKFYLLKGFVSNVINKPMEAQESFFTVLAKAEKENDVYVQAAALNGIGWSYQNLNDLAKSVEWYKKGIAVLHTSNQNIRIHKELMGVLHSNTGLAYYQSYKNSANRNFIDSANLYFDSAIYNCRQNGFIGVLAITLGTKSLLVQQATGNMIQSEKMLLEAISIRQKLGQLYFIIGDMSKLSEMYYQSHDYKRSILICLEAIRLADSSGIKSDIIYLYEILAKYFKADGQYLQYGNVLAIQIRIQDSINKVNAMSSLNELSVKYEVQKREALIAKQEYNLLKRKILIYAIIGCAIIILIFILVGFLKLKKRQRLELAAIKEEENRKLEAERNHAREKERERITADLHDDIGATLSSMSIYSDLAGTVMDEKPVEGKLLVGKISDTSKGLMERMGDIIWSMKPVDEGKYTLAARLNNYCSELLSPKSIEFKITIDSVLSASLVNPETRKNILLIGKEAINNAAKYSNASLVTLSLHPVESEVLFTIADNGDGFDTNKNTGGNGMQHIRQRCAALHGKVSINTSPGKGTEIKCIFPMAIFSQ